MIKAYRLILGIVILVAVWTQFLTFWHVPINFFSYFSVLSNIFGAIVFIFSSLGILNTRYTDQARAAATLYLLIVGTSFIILLKGDGEELIPWVNIVLHYVAPLGFFLDWIFTPSSTISIKNSLSWMWIPLLYVAYSFIRGAFTQWYPYVFFDPNQVGYTGVFTHMVVLVVGYFTASWIIITLKRRTYKQESKRR